MRKLTGTFIDHKTMADAGLSLNNLREGIKYAHDILDELDAKLIEVGSDRMSETVELANLSSMIGNLLAAGIVRHSENKFKRNGPHKFPDILSNDKTVSDIEIKISLETNKPKGHLAKEGYYLTCRYVLIDEKLAYNPNQRGTIAEIWEARFGYLVDSDFNLSNTAGDSGKTAVINKDGMTSLEVVYINLDLCPYTSKSPTFKGYQKLISRK